MVNYNKSMTKNKKVFVFLLAFAMMFLLSNVSASTLESYGTKQVNKLFTFTQVCADATYITLSSIETPTQTIYIDTNMTSTGTGQYSYNYTPTETGRYDFRGISDGCEKTFATYVEVTSSNITFLIILLVLASLFFIATLIVNEEFFVYISGVLFLISGIYIMTNGIQFVNDWYSRAISFVTLGLGLLFTLGAYIYNTNFKSSDEEEEEY